MMDRNPRCQDYPVRACQIGNQNFEQDPSSILRVPMEFFTEKFTWCCGIVDPELSQPVMPSRNANSFGPWDTDLSLTGILQVLTASHKDLH